MLNRLPERLDVFRLAERGSEVRGFVPIASMDRLAPLLAAAPEQAEVWLVFGFDDEKVVTVTGQVRAKLLLVCQRCLGPVAACVDEAVSLGVARDYQRAQHIPDRYDPLLLDDGDLWLSRLVEDELLLAVPQVPMHGLGLCAMPLHADVTEPGKAKSESPFSVLAGLKQDRQD